MKNKFTTKGQESRSLHSEPWRFAKGILVILLCCGYSPVVVAQNASENWWKAVDQKISPEPRRTVWLRKTVFPSTPHTAEELDELQARVRQQLIEHGVGEKEAEAEAKETRERSVQLANGATRTDTLSISSSYPEVLAEVVPAADDVQTKKIVNFQLFNYFDGVNAVRVDAIMDGNPRIYEGDLSREHKRILEGTLSRAVSQWIVAGRPLQDLISPSKSRVVDQGATVELTEEDLLGGELEVTKILTIRKSDALPTAFTVINRFNNRSVYRYEFSDWKQFASVWLPQKMAVNGGDRSEWLLLDVQAGTAFDPNSLKLPPRLTLSDARFGADQAVLYTIKDGQLLSDEAVKKLLGERPERAAIQAAQQSAQRTTNRIPLVLMAGLMLTVAGGMLWRKNARVGAR